MTRCGFAGISMLALAIGCPARAQVGDRAVATAIADSGNDIVVTATKRERTLHDVPISVAVTGAQTVQRAQIRDLIDLQSVVPSLKVVQLSAVGQTNFIIRGFGNGNGNDGIESSVGVFIDGVYRSRSAAALDDLPEIERIEVLRGPQSTLFGKNVSVGAISIVTKRPQFTFGGSAEIGYGSNNAMIARASLTGPLSQTLALRVSGNVDERDGFFTNLARNGEDINNRNRWSVRGDLLWQPTAALSVRIIADYNLIRERCCGVTSVYNGPRTVLLGQLGFGIPDTGPQTGTAFSRRVYANVTPDNRVRGEGISAEIDDDLGFARLTSITAYRDQINQTVQDIDFTGADLVGNTTANAIKTFTQEVRLTSQGHGPFSYLLGAFYQDERLDTGRTIAYGKDIRTYVNALTGGAVTQLERLQVAAGNADVVPGRTYFGAGQGVVDMYRLAQRSLSLFGQLDYKATDRLTLTGGLAYLNDRKATQSFVILTDRFSRLNLQNVPELGSLPLQILNPAAPAGAKVPTDLFGALGAVQFFYGNSPVHGPVNYPNASESGVVTGDRLTSIARVAYDFGAVVAYVSYATGWKAAAVNLSSDSRPPDASGVGRGAAPETVSVYEGGLKAGFRGGYLTLAVFRESIKGFQSNAFTGSGYALVNAGEESVRGFEVDTAYRPFAWLSLTGAVTYLDGRYDSFTGAACQSYDTVRCPRNPTTGQLPDFRDLSGDSPSGVPMWSAAASVTLQKDFGGGFSGYIRGEYDYTSDTWLSESTPPRYATWGVSIVNASIALAHAPSQLEIDVWGRNLTDDHSFIATFGAVVQDGSYSGYPSQPRTYGVTMRKRF